MYSTLENINAYAYTFHTHKTSKYGFSSPKQSHANAGVHESRQQNSKPQAKIYPFLNKFN